jgi:hypothetical protein
VTASEGDGEIDISQLVGERQTEAEAPPFAAVGSDTIIDDGQDLAIEE